MAVPGPLWFTLEVPDREAGVGLYTDAGFVKDVKFIVDGPGMGLADRAQDIIAFTCPRRDASRTDRGRVTQGGCISAAADRGGARQ